LAIRITATDMVVAADGNGLNRQEHLDLGEIIYIQAFLR
jgi:hypothetical protein